MSTLELTTLKEKTSAETVPVDTVIKGSAKAWVNFNGTGTVAIKGSFNVSSVTDNGVGNYTINLTTPMPDTNFALTVVGDTDATTNIFSVCEVTVNRSTGSVLVLSKSGGALVDNGSISAVFNTTV